MTRHELYSLTLFPSLSLFLSRRHRLPTLLVILPSFLLCHPFSIKDLIVSQKGLSVVCPDWVRLFCYVNSTWSIYFFMVDPPLSLSVTKPDFPTSDKLRQMRYLIFVCFLQGFGVGTKDCDSDSRDHNFYDSGSASYNQVLFDIQMRCYSTQYMFSLINSPIAMGNLIQKV